MSLARRLLAARGGAGSAAPPRAFTVYGNGAYPSATSAFHYSGVTYFGSARNNGDTEVVTFDHATGATASTILGSFGPDQHNSPALLRRVSDGRLVAAYCDHNGAAMYVRISTNPDDATDWGGATNIDASILGTLYTYPALFQLEGEASDPLYLFYRDNDGTSNWCLSKSTDDGATWSRIATICYATRAYGRCVKASPTRLDFAFTDGSYASEYADVYHCYYEGGAWYTSDGSAIAGSPPFAFASMTKLYDGATAGARFPNDITSDGSTIAVVFPVQTGTPGPIIAEDEDYIYARWDGSWATHAIATAVGGTTADYTEGGLAIDPADVGHVVISRRLAGEWRLYDCRTGDSGATWSAGTITAAGDPDMYPWFVRDAAPGLRFLWQKGTFTDETTWDAAIMGWGTA